MYQIRKNILLTLTLIAMVSLSCSLPSTLGDTIKDLIGDAEPILDEAQQTIEQNPTAQQIEEDLDQTNLPQQEIIEQAEETAGELLTSITSNDTSMLNSYRSSFIITTENDSEDATPQRIEMLEEINRTQSMYHNQIKSEGSSEDISNSVLDIYIQGDTTYLYNPATPEYPCVMIGSGTESLGDMEYLRPEDFFETIDTDQLLESGVSVNGIKTDHYSVKNSGIEMEEVYSSSAEIWVAQDGGYIVRFIGQAEGRFYTGEEIGDGKVTWEFNIFDVDAVNIIDFPVECRNQQKAVESVPIPENAINKEILAGIIMFESPDSPVKVGDFYRQQLPDNGWVITEDSSMSSLVMMTAEKDTNSLQIMISPGDSGGASIIISTVQME